jgi:hypothetical protein
VFDPMGGACRHMNVWQKEYQQWFGGCNSVKVTSTLGAVPGGVVGDVHRGVSHGRDVSDVGRGVHLVFGPPRHFFSTPSIAAAASASDPSTRCP